jgi:NAD(P)H-dependent flavin oxidoreductase YrpB (nitropropane dioxygenase family)
MFIISTPKLVIAQCIAGVVGSMPALNARPASQLDEWLDEITQALDAHNRAHPDQPAAPFAINQIVHKSNDRLEHDMGLCVKYKVPIIITSLGAREDINQAAHSYGGVVMHDIINNRFAHKAIEKGADGLIAVAAGAGGHAGTKSGLMAPSRSVARLPMAARCSQRKRVALTLPTLARLSLRPKRPAPPTRTNKLWSMRLQTTSSTAVCSRVCTATIWQPQFAMLA